MVLLPLLIARNTTYLGEIMDRSTIHTVNDLMNEAARALDRFDEETLEDLMAINENWLQDNESRSSINHMLEAMLEAVYKLREEVARVENDNPNLPSLDTP
jgi:mevalonate kinase